MELAQAVTVADGLLNDFRGMAQSYGAERYMLTEGPFPASTSKEKRKLEKIQAAEKAVREQIDALTVLIETGRIALRGPMSTTTP